MTILFDDYPADLCDMADARRLNDLIRRYINADHGYRRARLRRLQREVAAQLRRTTQED